MLKFNKNTLTEIASLGAGAVAGAYVSQKVLTKTAPVVDEKGAVVSEGTYLVGTGKTGKLIADVAPIAVGLFLQGQGNAMLKEAGKGMIAQAAGALIKANFPTLGLSGYSDDVMMAGTDGLDTGVDNPMISGTDNYGTDFSAVDAGEADF
jgi:hypothetical protein